MQRLSPKLEIVLVALLLTIGAAFLLKMCYLSLTLNTAFGLFFLRLRLRIRTLSAWVKDPSRAACARLSRASGGRSGKLLPDVRKGDWADAV